MVRFLERNGYDVSYIAGPDTDRSGSLLMNHKTFLSVGHDEYWSSRQRDNVVAARDAGREPAVPQRQRDVLATCAGRTTTARSPATETGPWATTKRPGRQDRPSTPEWTGTWRDPRFASRANGAGASRERRDRHVVHGQPLRAPGDGQRRVRAGCGCGATALAPACAAGPASAHPVDGGLRVRRGRRQRLPATRPDPALDHDRPRGSTARTSATRPWYRDHDPPPDDVSSRQRCTGLRRRHGAVVVGPRRRPRCAHRPRRPPTRMQQAQVNLLADMGAQPATLMAGLVPATASTDTIGPNVSIASGAAGQQPNGAPGHRRRARPRTSAVAGRRGRGLHRPGRHLAPRDGHDELELHLHPARVRRPGGARARRSTTAPTSVPAGAAHPEASCPARSSVTRYPPAAVDDPSANELGLRFVPIGRPGDGGAVLQGLRQRRDVHVGSLWSSEARSSPRRTSRTRRPPAGSR